MPQSLTHRQVSSLLSPLCFAFAPTVFPKGNRLPFYPSNLFTSPPCRVLNHIRPIPAAVAVVDDTMTAMMTATRIAILSLRIDANTALRHLDDTVPRMVIE